MKEPLIDWKNSYLLLALGVEDILLDLARTE
jgi:hypothetical protein